MISPTGMSLVLLHEAQKGHAPELSEQLRQAALMIADLDAKLTSAERTIEDLVAEKDMGQ